MVNTLGLTRLSALLMYPPYMTAKWVVDNVKDKKSTPQKKGRITKRTAEKNKGLIVIPYFEGVTERLSRVFKKHSFSTAMKPHCTLRKKLVHPKDKRDPLQTADIVYEIKCKTCLKS